MVRKLFNYVMSLVCTYDVFPIVSEAFANVGEDINVPPSVTLTISCGHLISTLVPFSNITWRKDGLIAANDSVPNLKISQDRHQLILAPTIGAVGGQIGNSGAYACTVCSDNACVRRQSRCEICSKLVTMID